MNGRIQPSVSLVSYESSSDEDATQSNDYNIRTQHSNHCNQLPSLHDLQLSNTPYTSVIATTSTAHTYQYRPGNLPLSIYITVNNEHNTINFQYIQHIIHTINQQLNNASSIDEWNMLNELHISLTRDFSIHHSIHHELYNELCNIIQNSALYKHHHNSSTELLFSEYKLYTNDNNRRIFIGLKLLSSLCVHNDILQLIQQINCTLSKYNLPQFYSKPDIHCSIASCDNYNIVQCANRLLNSGYTLNSIVLLIQSIDVNIRIGDKLYTV